MSARDHAAVPARKRRFDRPTLFWALLLAAVVALSVLVDPHSISAATEYGVPAWVFLVGLAGVSVMLIFVGFNPQEVPPSG